MKRTIMLVAAILSIAFLGFLCTSAGAQTKDRPPPKPENVLLAANAVTAIVTGPIVVPAAVAMGNVAGLCKVLGGTYTPNNVGADQCPGGNWVKIIPFLQSAPPAPKQ